MIIDRAEGNEFVDLLDTLWYVYTNEADADFETFCRIFKSKGVRNWINWLSYDVPAFALFLNNKYFLLLIVKVLIKLYAVIDKNKSGQVSVDQLMTFFTECTANKGWVFCVCRHMSWSSFNCYFFLNYHSYFWFCYYVERFLTCVSQDEPKHYFDPSPKTTASNSILRILKNWYLQKMLVVLPRN